MEDIKKILEESRACIVELCAVMNVPLPSDTICRIDLALSQQAEPAAERIAEGEAAARGGMGISDNPYVSGHSQPFTEAHDWQRGYDRAKQAEQQK